MDVVKMTKIYSTIVNKDIENEDEPYTVIKKTTFPSQVDAIIAFEKLSKHKNFVETWVLIMHSKSDFIDCENIVETSFTSTGGLTNQFIQNPMFRLKVRPQRNRRLHNSFDPTAGRHAQLLSMLDMSGRDEGIMSEFKLNDEQKDDVYAFHDAIWPKTNTTMLTTHETVMLVRNVLSYCGIPWIQLNFIDKGESCYFSVSTDKAPKKETGGPAHTYREDDHLEDISPSQDVIIDMEGLSLNLLETWGMQIDIILHELAHYITFITPIPLRFTDACTQMTQKDYAVIFSGHGILYATVLFHLLEKFHYCDRKWLRRQAVVHNIEFEYVNNLDPITLSNAIKDRI